MTQSSGSLSLLTVWYKPERSLQGLIQSGSGQLFALAITAAFGFVQSYALYRAASEPDPSLLILGPVLGVAMLFLFAWLMRNFSRWFGAQAQIPHLRLALGWGLLPWLAAFSFLAWFGGSAESPEELASFYPYFFAMFLYGYVILLLCLKSALGISLVKTFLCFVVTLMVSLFPITLIMQLIAGPPPIQ